MLVLTGGPYVRLQAFHPPGQLLADPDDRGSLEPGRATTEGVARKLLGS